MVAYEWDVETVTDGGGEVEVLDHNHCETFSEAMRFANMEQAPSERSAIVLVRDDDNGREWAYLRDGKLPAAFEDAYGVTGSSVPQRYHREVAKSGGAR